MAKTYEEVREKIEKDEYNAPSELYKTDKTRYREIEQKLAATFKADALEVAGLTGHPKADKVYSKAWENGHAYGYSEVLIHLLDLSELVLD
jgi:hypothetical protein